MQTVKLVMETVDVVIIAMHSVTAVQMFTALKVISISGCSSIVNFIIANSTDSRTCTDIGIYQCCTDTRTRACDVILDAQNNYCSCNASCHARGDCCSDAATFCVRKFSLLMLSNLMSPICNSFNSIAPLFAEIISCF